MNKLNLAFVMVWMVIFMGNLSAYQMQNLPEKGVPLLKNFHPVELKNTGKIWSIDTAPNGIVYMASDRGLLEYDGETWSRFVGSEGITRSVLVVSDSLIYTGSDLDFGVWKKKGFSKYEYESLYPFKEDLKEINEEFWNLFKIQENIVFVSKSNIYIYRNGSLTKISAPNEISESFKVDGQLYLVDIQEGLFQLQDLALKHFSQIDQYKNSEILDMYQNGEDLILVSKNEGLLRFRDGIIDNVNSTLSQTLNEGSVFSFERIGDKYIAFGTISKGVYISDKDGNIVHHINRNKGLQNNTILEMHYNSDGILWLSMDYGVSFLDLDSEFTFFFDYEGEFGTGYTAIIKDEVFYLGTNQGLYLANWNDLDNRSDLNNFELVPNTEGQVWSLKEIDGMVWMGHDKGMFKVEGKRVVQIGEQKGIWTIKPYKDVILAGTYNGISIYTNPSDRDWSYSRQMDLILGSCNQVFIEGDNTMWVNIPNYGIIRASLDDNFYPQERQIFESNIFGSSQHSLIQTDEGLKVQTDNKVFEFNNTAKEFFETDRENLEPEIDNQFIENTHPIELNDDFIFYSIYNGFALKDLGVSKSIVDSSYQFVFRDIKAFSKKHERSVSNFAVLPSQFRNIKIKGIVPNQNEVEYQYKFDDINEWSNWTPNNNFELLGLSYGDYIFSARAKVGGKVTAIKEIKFTISAPWYLTVYAYIIYILLFIGLIYSLNKWQQLSMKKLKKGLLINQQNSLREQAEKYQSRLKRIEREKLQAQYDQLKGKLKEKTIELATKAKENEEMGKVLEILKEKFQKLEQNPDSLKTRSNEIKQIIDSHINADDNTFEIQMDQLHQEFFDKLRKEFPDLTSYDLRLCAYLKLGFNSKEIANMLNIMPSSVYISRSRLRKKLDLESDKDLNSYLNSI
jgi:DNA-binding CsgD family transcriptional regulator